MTLEWEGREKLIRNSIPTGNVKTANKKEKKGVRGKNPPGITSQTRSIGGQGETQRV